jgi:hypothetical protein
MEAVDDKVGATDRRLKQLNDVAGYLLKGCKTSLM